MARVDVKVVLLGQASVGKSSLVERFINSNFDVGVKSTIGAAFAAKKILLSDGRGVTLGVWDTAGAERFEALSRVYYHSARAALLCFDATQPYSWEKLHFWVNELKEHEPLCKIFIVLTKCDLWWGPEKRQMIRSGDGLSSSLGGGDSVASSLDAPSRPQDPDSVPSSVDEATANVSPGVRIRSDSTKMRLFSYNQNPQFSKLKVGGGSLSPAPDGGLKTDVILEDSEKVFAEEEGPAIPVRGPPTSLPSSSSSSIPAQNQRTGVTISEPPSSSSSTPPPLPATRTVSDSEVEEYAKEIGAKVFETSSLTNRGVAELFREVAADVIDMPVEPPNPNVIKLHETKGGSEADALSPHSISSWGAPGSARGTGPLNQQAEKSSCCS